MSTVLIVILIYVLLATLQYEISYHQLNRVLTSTMSKKQKFKCKTCQKKFKGLEAAKDCNHPNCPIEDDVLRKMSKATEKEDEGRIDLVLEFGKVTPVLRQPKDPIIEDFALRSYERVVPPSKPINNAEYYEQVWGANDVNTDDESHLTLEEWRKKHGIGKYLNND